MTRSKIINSLTLELVSLTGDTEHMSTIRRYIEMALDVGINHFTKEMEEIVMVDGFGHEIDRFRCLSEAENKTGIDRRHISLVLLGQRHTAGDCRFIKAKDMVLIPKTDKYGIRSIHTEKERAG